MLSTVGVCLLGGSLTFGGSGGIMTTARPELPYPCNSQAKSGTKLLSGGSNVTGCARYK